MSLFDVDNNFGKENDPLKADKNQDRFKIDFNLVDSYSKSLTDTMAESAGGDGGALPGSVPGAGKMADKTEQNRYRQPQPDPVADIPNVKTPAIEPIKPIRIDPVKPFAPATITLAQTVPVKKTAAPQKPASSWTEEGIENLNSLAKPMQQEADDTGTLGIRINQEIQTEPDGFARAADTLNKSTYTGYERTVEVAEPAYFFAKARSLKNRQDMASQLARLFNATADAPYGMTSDRAHGMAGWRGAQFSPSVINRYSDYERRLARDTVSTALNKREELTWNPDMAKKQVYPVLDRINRYHGYDSLDNTGFSTAQMDWTDINRAYGYDDIDNTGFADARFSMDDLKEQITDHMVKKQELTYEHMKQTSLAMASLDRTGYGEKIRNIMGSAYTGVLSIGQETSYMLANMLTGYPPAEVMAFDLQMNLSVHGNDMAGWASELEANRHYAKQVGQDVYGFWENAKTRTRGMRSEAYNNLEYFAADPAQSALRHPDKLTGDFFEKVIPMMVSLALPTKASAIANFEKVGTLFSQFTWIGTRAFNLAAADRVNTLIANPHLVDSNPEFHIYCIESFLPDDEARATFIEAEGRRAGVQSGLISLATAAGSGIFKGATSTGSEGIALDFFQHTILNMIGEVVPEAIGVSHEKIVDDAIEGDEKR